MEIPEQSALPGPAALNLLTSIAQDNLFNGDLYIICQDDTKAPLTSENTGRASVKRAAKIRNDVVTKRKRIKSVIVDDEEDNGDGVFYHHNNNCFYPCGKA